MPAMELTVAEVLTSLDWKAAMTFSSTAVLSTINLV